ncbi:helix-turn-helix domain-containing protein [Pigmentiphaga soli]|uniref:Helix-turn-helix domain-containing protein n=1 Tax=Pigmentiphaga soli TaxID=1007095 RepID=A0ABP8GT47_9BURK
MTDAVRLYQGPFGRAALLDSDHDLMTHAHPQCHVLIKAGGADAAYQVRDRKVALSADSMVLVNAWEPHLKFQPPAGERSMVLVLCVEPLWLAEYDSQLSGSGMPDFFPSPSAAMPPSVRKLADRLIAEMLSCAPGEEPSRDIEVALSDLMLSLTHLYAMRRSWVDTYRLQMRQRTDARITRAIRYLGEHLGEVLNCEDLARMHHLSRQHFFSLFRQCTNVSPILYLNTLRMESAFRTLGGSAATVNVVANDLGFSEPHHFTRFFRRNLGIPPSEYRRTVSLVQPDGGRQIPTSW